MSVGDISSRLLADWVPSLPAAVSSSFIGWPPFLVDVANLNGNDFLALRSEAGRSERQWKSVLSWMLGIAGTRHVLESERYRWIAPLSAFYPGCAQAVDVSAWHTSFPCSSVIARRRPGTRCRLRPGYLALRSTAPAKTGRPYEWAIAEAKGTQIPLAKIQTCPTDWSRQARSVVLIVRGSQITAPRHLVIATRVNPNAASAAARRLQVRAWNQSEEPKGSHLQTEAAVDIAAAHLFGLFRGLGLRGNALAIALSVQARTQFHQRQFFTEAREQVRRASNLAESELRERLQEPIGKDDVPMMARISVPTERGPVHIDLAEPLMSRTDFFRH